MSEPRLIRMVRSAEQAQGGPTQADVHPDEVAQYAAAGFAVPAASPSLIDRVIAAVSTERGPVRQKTAQKIKE